jgi:hypothetical protein
VSDKGFPQWMMTVNQEVVALKEPLQISDVRNTRRLAFFSTIAFTTGQNKIPDSVQIVVQFSASQNRVREEVVNVGQKWASRQHADFTETVKASAFLIAVQGIS